MPGARPAPEAEDSSAFLRGYSRSYDKNQLDLSEFDQFCVAMLIPISYNQPQETGY